MERYFYHGIEPYYGCFGEILETMYKILQEGLKTRKEVRNYDDEEFSHICLYKKNEEIDYTDEKNMIKSAASGWINNCCVFIIDKDVEAEKTGNNKTDLIDEWRSKGDISPSKIKGIALPFETIKEYLEEEIDDEEIIKDQEKVRKMLPIITEHVLNNNLLIMDSEVPNFTDELDESLNSMKKI